MAGNNPAVATEMFRKATTADPGMCDAWLARIVAGEDSAPVRGSRVGGARSLRLGDPPIRTAGHQVSPDWSSTGCSCGWRSPPGSLRSAYAVALIREQRYADADTLLHGPAPTDPFDADAHAYAQGLLHFQAKRWPDVLGAFSTERGVAPPAYAVAAAAMAATALASLGCSRTRSAARPPLSTATWCRRPPPLPCTRRRCACGTWTRLRTPINYCGGCIRATRIHACPPSPRRPVRAARVAPARKPSSPAPTRGTPIVHHTPEVQAAAHAEHASRSPRRRGRRTCRRCWEWSRPNGKSNGSAPPPKLTSCASRPDCPCPSPPGTPCCWVHPVPAKQRWRGH